MNFNVSARIKYTILKLLIWRHLRAGGARNLLILNDLLRFQFGTSRNKNTKKMGGLRPPFFLQYEFISQSSDSSHARDS